MVAVLRRRSWLEVDVSVAVDVTVSVAVPGY